MSQAATRAQEWNHEVIRREADEAENRARAMLAGGPDSTQVACDAVGMAERVRRLSAELERVTRERDEAVQIEAGDHEAIPSRKELVKMLVAALIALDDAARDLAVLAGLPSAPPKEQSE